MRYEYRKNTTMPSVPVNVQDTDGSPAALASGWTFAVKIATADDPNDAVVNKTSGITGSDTYPSVVIDWAANDFANLNPADVGTVYYATLIGTSGGENELLGEFEIGLKPAITDPS